MKPARVLLFVYTVFILLFLVALLFPEEGIDLGCCKLEFANPKKIFSLPEEKKLTTEVQEEVKNADQLIKEAINDESKDTVSANSLDKTFSTDTIVADNYIKKIDAAELKKNLVPIQFNNEKDRIAFWKFFKRALRSRRELLRVLYYGDSQIEADRITSFLRYKFQKIFGGYGPGMVPPVNFVKFFSLKQWNDDSWHRYSIMEYKKNNVAHRKYGILASFANYDTSSEIKEHTLTFEKAHNSYSNTRKFDKLTVFYGLDTGEVVLKVFVDGKIMDFSSLQCVDLGTYSLSLPRSAEKIDLQFSGNGKPDIYAVAFDSKSGVVVDNIAIRGCSGLFFKKLNSQHFAKFFDKIKVGLVILEFGGNVLPYLKNEKECENYGRYFSAQLHFLKRILRGVPVLVVGPADMSVKQDGEYVTYPLLTKVRDEMKKAAFSNGAGFWDMYEAMGGENSMPAWVNEGLAAPDYTHFTSKGAAVVANMLNNAIMNEFYTFRNKK
jgi:lysophospholipase L1-like esterase